METAQRLRAVDKKLRRQARHKIRQDGKGIEGVITTTAGALRAVVDRPIDMERLYAKAKHDMGLRTRLSIEGRTNPGAAKRRRQLNDWELDTAPQTAGDSWQEDEGKRRAVGRCSVKAVSNKADFKANGAKFTR